jgi:hypothetical protein
MRIPVRNVLFTGQTDAQSLTLLRRCRRNLMFCFVSSMALSDAWGVKPK